MIKNFTGTIIQPGNAGYDTASRTFTTKGNPAIILQPKTAQDVGVAIEYAASENLVIAVRSGGHSGAGLSTVDGGAVIDLSLINQVKILDSDQGVVCVGAGAKWGDALKKLGTHGLAISSGDTASVGVGGLTLGGGMGWMVRNYGLAIDSLLAAEVVTADGKILRASETEHPDLFWAIRGGGGNFGIVTQFEFQAHPVAQVVAGPITYKLENLAHLLKGWRDYMRTAPLELTTTFTILPSFGGNPPMAIITCCYVGDEAAGRQAIEPLLTLATPIDNKVAAKPYAEVLEDVHPGNARIIVRNSFFKELSDELIQVIVQQEGLMLQMRSLGGAINEVPVDATAFEYRDDEVFIVAPTFVSPDATERDVEVAFEPWRRIAKFGHGAYFNFLSTADEAAVTSCYSPATYKRLAAIKATYDPKNVFHRNYNIKPAR